MNHGAFTLPMLVCTIFAALQPAANGFAGPADRVATGHASAPFRVAIEFPDGELRRCVLVGVDSMGVRRPNRIRMVATGNGGSRVPVWLDTIQEIRDMRNGKFTLVFKSGARRSLSVHCHSTTLYITTEQDK